MQKLQDSVFSIVKTTNLSPAVFSYLQPDEDFSDKTPLGGILSDTKHGWLALGPKFCVVDLRTGLKVAARTFGAALSNYRSTVTSVVELPSPLTNNSQQLLISLECEDIAGMICVFHINGSQILRCIRTETVVTQLSVCDGVPDGPFSCFDGVVMAGTKNGEILVFDLNRACLIQALKDISQGYEDLVRGEENIASITFLPLSATQQMEAQRDLALENDDHIAVLLNESSLIDGQYIFRNPDGTVRMKAKRDHIRVTVIQYVPQLGSLAVGFNFGAFQLWNLLTLDLEFTSQVNVECLPVTHFGFQEPCDDPRAFCYLWVVFSVLDRFDEEEFPLAVMYSFNYQGKRMLSDTQCLYQEFISAAIRFQLELSTTEENAQLIGGRSVSCHTYSVNSMLGEEGEDSMLNICQLVWECWGENPNVDSQYGMLLFDLDQWYKDQMPATYRLQSNAFMSATTCRELSKGAVTTLDVRLAPSSVSVYCAATRLEEHFYPNSLHYDCICLNTAEACVLSTIGIQRQIINSLDEVGPTALLNPTRLYNACVATGLVPLYMDTSRTPTQAEQRRYLLSVALEARLSRFLKRCAHDWATGSHAGAGCTLPFLVEWCWQRAIELKENARELTAPLFTSSALPDRNVIRCLEHCVQQLTQLTGLLDAVLTKCCNLVVPDALSEMEEKYKGIGTVSLYFQVVQWFLRCGLLPERNEACDGLPYPGSRLANTYTMRRLKLHRLQDHGTGDENAIKEPCSLLYIDQLIEQEFGGERIRKMWVKAGSTHHGLYPPPSLYALLRLYLLADVADEHKHELVLYLLVDYSSIYDEVRYEAVIRRLMQFPTMFGLSNTAIKATQAFWHLDHRDFDFALDQLQCLTGNTLSEWQHNVVLSSLLAQKKTQAALQYLHVRKPAPIQNISNEFNSSNNRVNDHDKLDDWQSCCSLYLARGLVFEALDVIRMCVQNAATLDDKAFVLNFFFKGCRNTGQLSKILQVTLMPLEEEIFIRYLEGCNESQTSDILIMYYLQQARYLEAEQYNKKIKQSKPSRVKELNASLESLADIMDREGARDTIVEVVCASLPNITNTVAHCALDKDFQSHIIAPKPMSVFIQATSPKNTFTYKSSFIQDTIENASETWINKPKMRRGLKRALNIEDTPFICTPKMLRAKSIFTDMESESTPPKRARLDLSCTPKTPRSGHKSAKLSKQLETLLDMPDVQSPDYKIYERSGTPHSILKIRHNEARDQPSPVDSRYLGDSDDEMLETASNNTHYSDSTNKHLRFTIPTASESGSTPSPPLAGGTTHFATRESEKQLSSSLGEKEADISVESYATTQSHTMNDPNPLESPPKKLATEEKVHGRKSYKDSVRARRSLSISVNSSLSDDPNTSMESIADIPITLINPRYSGERRGSSRESHEEDRDSRDVTLSDERDREENRDVAMACERDREESRDVAMADESAKRIGKAQLEVPRTPRGRRGIRAISGESTPLLNRSRSVTPERQDSPVITTPLRGRSTRSRSKTPEISPRSSPLEPILEQPKQEVESEPHPYKTTLSVPRQLRSRSRTPDRAEKVVESPRLEAISESPTKSPEKPASPPRRSLRSRSRTPEIEAVEKPVPNEPLSPRTFRSRSKTPEKLLSPKTDVPKSAKKSLSRIVLESNAVKVHKKLELTTETIIEERSEKISIIECTPMKSAKPNNLMDVTISPIASKSILQSPNDSVFSETKLADSSSTESDIKSLPAFTMNETKFGKSVLHSYESSTAEYSENKTKDESRVKNVSIPVSILGESMFGKSVLHSYHSSVEETSVQKTECKEQTNKDTEKSVQVQEGPESTSLNVTDFDKSILCSVDESKTKISSLMTSDSEIEMKEDNESVIQKEKEKIVEIEREIHEIENEISDGEHSESSHEGSGVEFSEQEESGEELGEEEEEDDEGSDSYGSESEEVEEEEDAEIISIGSSSSESEHLKIDEKSKTSIADAPDPTPSVKPQIETVVEVEPIETSSKAEEIDPLNIGHTSLLTDDNSVFSERSEVGLSFSDEKEGVKGKDAKDSEMESLPTKVLPQTTEEKQKDSETTKTSQEHEKTSASQENSANNEKALLNREVLTKTVQSNRDNKESSTTSNPILIEIEIEVTTPITTIQTESKVTKAKESDIIESELAVLKKHSHSEVNEPSSIFPDVRNTIAALNKQIPLSETKDDPKTTAMDVEIASESGNRDEKINVQKVTEMEIEQDAPQTDRTESPVVEFKKTVEMKEAAKDSKMDIVQEVSETDKRTETLAVEIKKAEKTKETPAHEIKKADETKETVKGVTPEKQMKLQSVRARTPRRVLKTPDRETKSIEQIVTEADMVKTLRPRRRANSTSSNVSSKSTKEPEISQSEEPKTKDPEISQNEEPKTPTRSRKRSQSVASNKSNKAEDTTEVTPEIKDTPSRRRGKTPTSVKAKTPTSEGRKILTRRASKEIEKLDESQSTIVEESETQGRKILTRRASKEIEKLDESQSTIVEESETPRRRTTRSQSKLDDSMSVASESSVRSAKSTRSKASEDASDLKPTRKGRKSVIKPDLSVIPELVAEETTSKTENKEDIIKEYSNSRRLTRRQKSLLESWLESPQRRAGPPTPSRASRSVVSDTQSRDDDETSPTHSAAFDVQSMDRISLLNKTDFQGSPDSEEAPSTISPESIASDATKQRKPRISRAVSESRTTPKAARIVRRISVDIAGSSEVGSPAALVSPARGRRASFTRACEALHTPKGRATPTEKKSETSSQRGSPVSEVSSTPSRRSARKASVNSVSSQPRTDTPTGKRSKVS